MIKSFKYLFVAALALTACSEDDTTEEVVVITPGEANFAKYVALGDSFAAGFSDGALFKSGQENAYPNILAEQFALAGGGAFTTPFMLDDIGGFSLGGSQVPGFGTRLVLNGTTPVSLAGIASTQITDQLSGAFNNLGVPGAKSFHLVAPGYGQLNPYFGRFDSAATATVLGDAVAQSPTFFSLWIGGNDVLGYATSGGTGTNQTGNLNPATYGQSDITDPTVFAATYSNLVDALTAGGAKGVVANLPYINALPYFTTVPHNPVPLNAQTAATLMSAQAFGAYNAGLQFAATNGLISQAEAQRRTISFTAGNNNAVLLTDSYLTNLTSFGIPSIRQATNEDFIVLPARAVIGTAVNNNPQQINGVSVPLADQWVLTKDEVAEIKTATDAYNAAIEQIATAKGLALVDVRGILEQLKTTGIVRDGFTLRSDYVTGNTFSLDGIHPGPRGYAFIANLFLDAINTKYGSNIPNVKMGDYNILYGPQIPFGSGN